MGSGQIQGELWGARAREWAELQESSFRPLYQAAFDAAGIQKGCAVLDVGCGAGLAVQVAVENGATASGLDAAAGLVAIARERSPGADIRVGEIEELPFSDDAFDIVSGFNSFQYAANPVKALSEAKRVAKPGGGVVIAVWGAPEKCELSGYIAALGKLLPPPPPGSGGPFALSAPGALEELVGKAGLKPEGAHTVTTTMNFSDEQTMVRGLIASGVAERALRHSGEAAVAQGVMQSSAPFRQPDGSYRFNNEWRFLVSRA
jgi:SAM-dependent methyltransferase